MDVEYSCLQREYDALHWTLVLAITLAIETDSFQGHWLQAYEMSLQTAYIFTELETLWDFIHVHCRLLKAKNVNRLMKSTCTLYMCQNLTQK